MLRGRVSWIRSIALEVNKAKKRKYNGWKMWQIVGSKWMNKQINKYTRIQIHILVIFLVELEFENTGFCLDGKTEVARERPLKTKGKINNNFIQSTFSITAVIASVLTTAPPLFPVFFFFTAWHRFASWNMKRRSSILRIKLKRRENGKKCWERTSLMSLLTFYLRKLYEVIVTVIWRFWEHAVIIACHHLNYTENLSSSKWSVNWFTLVCDYKLLLTLRVMTWLFVTSFVCQYKNTGSESLLRVHWELSIAFKTVRFACD